MVETLTQHWWTWLIRGVLAILFGVIAFVQPGATALALVWTFGVYAIADGILLIWGAIAGRTDSRLWYVIWGVVSILAGVVAFAQPAVTGITLVWVIAAWAVVIGILQIIAAIQLRQEIDGEFWLILAGILSVVAGVLLFAAPGLGGLSLVYLIGVYAVLLGIAFIGFAFRVKQLGERASTAPTAAMPGAARLTTRDATAPAAAPTPAATAAAAPGPGDGRAGCDPSYPDVCIPSPPPLLNCRDIPHRNFRVVPPDPHGFDTDQDGIGCESRARTS